MRPLRPNVEQIGTVWNQGSRYRGAGSGARFWPAPRHGRDGRDTDQPVPQTVRAQVGVRFLNTQATECPFAPRPWWPTQARSGIIKPGAPCCLFALAEAELHCGCHEKLAGQLVVSVSISASKPMRA